MSGRWIGVRGVIAAASAGLCIAGAALVTQGVAVPVKAEVAQVQLERVFEQRLAAQTSAAIQPTPPVQAEPSRKLENPAPQTVPPAPRQAAPQAATLPATGPVARLSVKRLGVKETVLAGHVTDDGLARGPMLLKQEDAGNPVTILAAHRDTHFLFIRDLREGDEVSLQLVTGETRRYRVTRFETVRWDEFTYPLSPAQPMLALATCYPFGGTEYGGPLRRVAWATQIA